MAMTLLQMVQRIAQYINGETVNSINDTRESEQLAIIVKETYQHLILMKQIRSKNKLFQLEAVSDTSKPTYFTVQSPIIELDYIKYLDRSESDNFIWTDLRFMEPEQFIERSLNLIGKNNVDVITDYSGITLYVENDKAPQYYTMLDDIHVILNSYNKSIEQTVQTSNVSCKGTIMPAFNLTDDFTPDIAEQHFPLLLSQSKLNADMEIKRNFNQLEGDRATRESVITDNLSKRIREEQPALWKNRMRTGRNHL